MPPPSSQCHICCQDSQWRSAWLLGGFLSITAYATISVMLFIAPNFPGQHPTICQGSSAAVTANTICHHTKSIGAWHKFINISTALKNQLLHTIKPIYVCALHNHHIGFMNITAYELITNLFHIYGNIMFLEIEDNDTSIQCTSDPNTPVITSFIKVRNAHLFHIYGNIMFVEIEDNDTSLEYTWDPNTPFDCLIQQDEEYQEFTKDVH